MLDERVSDSFADDPARDPLDPRAVKRVIGSWRLAARLARREVRHRWGRTIMVVLLIAVPVAGMAIADTAYRSQQVGSDNVHFVGSADGRYDFNPSYVTQPTDVGDLRPVMEPAFPAGTTSLWATSASLSLRRAGARVLEYGEVTDIDLRSPLAAGLAGATDGRFPEGNDEVWLSRRLANQFGVRVGDSLTLTHPQQTFTVVGVGRNGDDDRFESVSMDAPGFDFTALRAGYAHQYVLVAGGAWKSSIQATDLAVQRALATAIPPTPDAIVGGEPQPAVSAQFSMPSRNGSTVEQKALATGWLFGTLAMVVLGVIVAAAFAVSGRRQLVTVGQMSAQGASASTVRRFLSLQGSFSGLVGAVVGVAAGIAIWRSSSSLIDGPRSVGVNVRDLIVIGLTATIVATVAASLPSRSMARVSVLTALGGRRPVGVVPRRIVPIGVLITLAGMATIVLAAVSARTRPGGDVALMLLAAVGAVATLGGVCCLCPAIIQWVGNIAGRRGGSLRFAARSLVRHRVRSAALLASIVAVGAAGIALATLGEQHIDNSDRTYPGLPDKVMMILSQTYAGPDVDYSTLDPSEDPTLADPDARQRVEAVVGPVTWVPTQKALDLATYASTDATGVNRGFGVIDNLTGAQLTTVAIIATPELLDILGVDDAGRKLLAQHDAIYFDSGASSYVMTSLGDQRNGGEPAIVVPGVADAVPIPVVHQRAHVFDQDFFLVTPKLVEQMGLDVVGGPTYAIAASSISVAQQRALVDTDANLQAQEAQVFRDLPLTGHGLQVQTRWIPTDDHSALYRIGISAAALALVLLVVGFGMALWAAEGRDEQTMLAAIGASPSTLTNMTAWRALILTVAGVWVAVPLGYATVWMIEATGTDRNSAPFPWIVAAAILVAVPVLVTVFSYLASRLSRTLRPHPNPGSDE